MQQPPEITESQPESPEAPGMSLAGRMLNVFAGPTEVFDAVKKARPSAWNWAAPALVFILASWVGAALIFSQPAVRQQLNDITEQAIQKRIQKGQMSQEQADQAREVGAKYAGMFQKAGAVVGPVVVGFSSPFIWGLFLWLAGTKLLKGNFGYMKAVEVAGLGNMLLVLDAIVRTLLIVIMGNLYASPSAALLLKNFDPQNSLHGLLALVNVITFWLLAVRSIGLARLASVSLVKAGTWVFGIWAGYTAFFFGVGAAARAAFGR